MFVWTLDLRLLLFGILLLPFVGALIALALSRWNSARQRILEQAALLDSLFAQAPMGLLFFSLDNHNNSTHERAPRLLAVNNAAHGLLGIPEPQKALPQAPWTEQLLTDIQEDGRYRTVVLPQDGEGAQPESRVVRWWVKHHTHSVLVLLFDMTNEQQAEASANRLLSDLSHELRTPLATLLTHLEVLSLSDLAADVQAQSIDFMKAETQRLARMSNQTLELGRLQAGATAEPQPFSMQALVESAVAQMQVEAAAQDARITIDADESLPPVLGEPDQIRQVLLNLIENAIKYGGAHNRIVVLLQQDKRGVSCSVRDSGPGIPAEHLANLGRRYYRAAAPSGIEGSGLGLAMAREILRRHNSKLEIASQTSGEGRGTTVGFVLPSVEEATRGEND